MTPIDDAALIEAMARAVVRFEYSVSDDEFWDGVAPIVQRHRIDSARAALAAIRPLLAGREARAWREGAEAARSADIAFILGGRFLHDEAPPARFARELTAALLNEPLPPPPDPAP